MVNGWTAERRARWRTTKRVGERFALTTAGIEEAGKRLHQARVHLWESALVALVAGLGRGWVLVAIVGCVARGFFGIPRGTDSRTAA